MIVMSTAAEEEEGRIGWSPENSHGWLPEITGKQEGARSYDEEPNVKVLKGYTRTKREVMTRHETSKC